MKKFLTILFLLITFITNAQPIGFRGHKVGFSSGSGGEIDSTYSDYLVAYATKAGLTNNSTVLYPGTDQERTVKFVKDSLNMLFRYMERQHFFTTNKLFAFYPCMGTSLGANAVNAVDTSLPILTYPLSMSVSPWGLKGNGTDQYAATGIHPYPDLYNNGSQDIATYTDDSTQGYFAIYTSGGQAALKSYNGTSTSIWLQGYDGWASHFDYGGENATNARIITFTDIGKRRFLQGSRTGKSSSILKNFDSTIGTTSTPIGMSTFFPTAQFELGTGSNAPFSFVFIGNKGLTESQLDSMGYWVKRVTKALGRDETSPVQSPPPSNLVVLDSLNLLRFTVASGSVFKEQYAISLDNEATWIPLSDSFCRERTTITGTPFNPKQYDVFVDNFTFPSGTVKLKVLGRTGVEESTAVATSDDFTWDEMYDRWAAAYLRYDDVDDGSGSNQQYQQLTWELPFGIKTEDFHQIQYTNDSGATWHRAEGTYYTRNQPFAANQLGIRTITVNLDAIDDIYDISKDSVISNPVYYQYAITAKSHTTINVVGLHALDSSVRATLTAGSPTVTLNSTALHFKVGDPVIVESNGTAGGGLRGTRGLKTWPLRYEPDSATAMANISSYIPNEYFGAGWDSGYTYRWNNDKTAFGRYNTTHPDRNFIISRPLEATVVGISSDSLTLTLSGTPDVNGSNCKIHFDNRFVLNRYSKDSVHHHTILNVPAGVYPMGGRWQTESKFDLTINAKGVTLLSIPGARGASFTTERCDGLNLNQTAGTGKLSVLGNYTFNTMGFAWPGDTTVTSNQWYPGRDETFTNDVTVLNPAFGLWAKFVYADSLRGKNVAHALIQGGNSMRWHGLTLERDNIIAPGTIAGAVPYFGSYYWGPNLEGVTTGIIDGININYERLMNGFEVFNCRGVTIRNVVERNAHNSMNGSAKCLYENITVTIDSNSRTYQNSGHPIFENNVFEKNHGWSYKNVLHNIDITILGSEFDTENYSIGVIDRGGTTKAGTGQKTTNGMRIKKVAYHRPDMHTAFAAFPGQAFRMAGHGTEVDSCTVTGYWDSTDLATNGIWYEHSASVAVGAIDCDDDDIYLPKITHTTAPTFIYPATSITSGNTTTQSINAQTAFVCAGTDTTITGTTFTFQPTVVPPSPGSVLATEWIFKSATDLSGNVINYGGTSTTSVAIPTSFPQSISVTTQTGLTMPTGSNLYLYNEASNKLITGKVTSYNSSTGALVMNATTADGATGTYADWDVNSEPLIDNIYTLNATATIPTPGIYVYQLKVTVTGFIAIRDYMGIIKH